MKISKMILSWYLLSRDNYDLHIVYKGKDVEKYSRNSSYPNIIVNGKFSVLKCKWIISNEPWNVTYTVKRPPTCNVTLNKSPTFSEFPSIIIQIKIQWFNYKIIF